MGESKEVVFCDEEEEQRLIVLFGLAESTRVNAPPIQPYDACDDRDEDQEALREVCAPTKQWRADSCAPQMRCCSEFESKIVSHCNRFGAQSSYATARCSKWGLTCLHAASMNGYLQLVKTFITVAKMDPLFPTARVLDGLAHKDGYRGADALWLARKRGHHDVVDFLLTLPAVRDADDKSIPLLKLSEQQEERSSHEAQKVKEKPESIAANLRARRERERRRGEALAVGDRVLVGTKGTGTVRYAGEVHYANGFFIGVDLDDDTKGKHSGTVKDHAYFDTGGRKNAGIIIFPSDITLRLNKDDVLPCVDDELPKFAPVNGPQIRYL